MYFNHIIKTFKTKQDIYFLKAGVAKWPNALDSNKLSDEPFVGDD